MLQRYQTVELKRFFVVVVVAVFPVSSYPIKFADFAECLLTTRASSRIHKANFD